MPRGKRILMKEVSYHVFSRGNQKKNIFREEKDYLVFLKLLWKYKQKFPFKLYAYCLMANHFHLLIDPKDPGYLKKIMHGIKMSYTIWHNNNYDKCGHLWQGRYKSPIISKDKYLFNCINYIEYNPVRSKITTSPEEYKWSSYLSRILNRKDRLLDYFEY